MRKLIFVLWLILVAAIGVACSTNTSTASTTSAVGTPHAIGTPGFNDRPISGLTQLLIGTFKLEGTDLAVTSAQAKTLLPLWQAVQSLSTSGTAATEEMTSLENQIRETLTAEQQAQIDALQLGPSELQTLASDLGLTFGNGNDGTDASGTAFPRGGDGFGPPPEGGAFFGDGGPGGPGGGALTEDQLATLEARRANRPALTMPPPFMEALIELLTTRASEN